MTNLSDMWDEPTKWGEIIFEKVVKAALHDYVDGAFEQIKKEGLKVVQQGCDNMHISLEVSFSNSRECPEDFPEGTRVRIK